MTDTSGKGSLFLIGNGRSLGWTDLSRLCGRESWAMNRIHLLYPKTEWRPTRWFWADMPQREYHREDIAWHVKSGLYPCYIRHDVLTQVLGRWESHPGRWDVDEKGVRYFAGPWINDDDLKHCVPWVHCKTHSSQVWGDKVPQSWHPDDPIEDHLPELPNCYPKLICKFGSGFSALLQMACAEGYNPVYLVGCDLGFQAQGKDGKDYNHFDPDYWNDYMVTSEEAERTEKGIIHSHTLAKAWADEHGVQILNATKGGVLEVYPRVEYDDLF